MRSFLLSHSFRLSCSFLFLSVEKEDINLIWVVKNKIATAIKEVARSNFMYTCALHQKTITLYKFTINNKQKPQNQFLNGAGGRKER